MLSSSSSRTGCSGPTGRGSAYRASRQLWPVGGHGDILHASSLLVMDRPTIPLGYVAGVIDARGHIEVNNRHGKPQPRVRITTKRIELLQHLATHHRQQGGRGPRGLQPAGLLGALHRAAPAHRLAEHPVDRGLGPRHDRLYNIQPLIVAQVDKVRTALMAGLTAFPPERGNTPQVMYDLGWDIPDELVRSGGFGRRRWRALVKAAWPHSHAEPRGRRWPQADHATAGAAGAAGGCHAAAAACRGSAGRPVSTRRACRTVTCSCPAAARAAGRSARRSRPWCSPRVSRASTCSQVTVASVYAPSASRRAAGSSSPAAARRSRDASVGPS